MQSQNLKVTSSTFFFRQCKSKIQTGGWVLRPLDPEVVFPKENESGEAFCLVSYARGLTHGAALEPHVAYVLHCYLIRHASVNDPWS